MKTTSKPVPVRLNTSPRRPLDFVCPHRGEPNGLAVCAFLQRELGRTIGVTEDACMVCGGPGSPQFNKVIRGRATRLRMARVHAWDGPFSTPIENDLKAVALEDRGKAEEALVLAVSRGMPEAQALKLADAARLLKQGESGDGSS